jgi:hypothetical protein
VRLTFRRPPAPMPPPQDPAAPAVGEWMSSVGASVGGFLQRTAKAAGEAAEELSKKVEVARSEREVVARAKVLAPSHMELEDLKAELEEEFGEQRLRDHDECVQH